MWVGAYQISSDKAVPIAQTPLISGLHIDGNNVVWSGWDDNSDWEIWLYQICETLFPNDSLVLFDPDTSATGYAPKLRW